LDELTKDLQLRAVETPDIAPLPGGTMTAILGHQFLVLDDPRMTEEELLKEAVVLSSERVFRRKRANFWRWQREFMDDKGITDQAAIRDAVKEMRDLLEDEKQLVRKAKIKTSVQFAFLVGSVAIGLVGGPLTPLAIGGAFLSVGSFAADKLFEEYRPEQETSVALFRDTKKHFGWK
jgi:hypothetical protein